MDRSHQKCGCMNSNDKNKEEMRSAVTVHILLASLAIILFIVEIAISRKILLWKDSDIFRKLCHSSCFKRIVITAACV